MWRRHLWETLNFGGRPAFGLRFRITRKLRRSLNCLFGRCPSSFCLKQACSTYFPGEEGSVRHIGSLPLSSDYHCAHFTHYWDNKVRVTAALTQFVSHLKGWEEICCVIRDSYSQKRAVGDSWTFLVKTILVTWPGLHKSDMYLAF